MIFFNNLHLDILLIQHRRQIASGPTSTDDHDPFHFLCSTRCKAFTKFFDSLRVTDKIGIIMWQETIMRDDHAMVSEYHPGQD